MKSGGGSGGGGWWHYGCNGGGGGIKMVFELLAMPSVLCSYSHFLTFGIQF